MGREGGGREGGRGKEIGREGGGGRGRSGRRGEGGEREGSWRRGRRRSLCLSPPALVTP